MVYFRELNQESVLILRNESNATEDEICYSFEENDTLDGNYWKMSESY